jgi:hypothetical protein
MQRPQQAILYQGRHPRKVPYVGWSVLHRCTAHRHGKYYKTDEDMLLFGAKRPHFPYNCTLYRDEVFVAAEMQWDHIMRFMNFTTNR